MNKRFAIIRDCLLKLRRAGKRNATSLSDLDYGVLSVGFLVAALDGNITDEELALLKSFAEECDYPIGDQGSMRALDVAVRSAGYLSLSARMSLQTDDDRLANFLNAVNAGLPHGFVGGTREDLAFAFTFWTALAITDGDFSPVERRAIELLKERFDNERALKRHAELFVARQVAALSTDYDKTVKELGGEREPSLLGEDFTTKAEEMLMRTVAEEN